jgi:predicted negative regulator of RcsB-dependent stress response
MMEGLNTESQELLLLKQYWQKYGKLLIGALLLILVFMAGTRYWQQRKAQQAELASQAYQEMLLAEFAGDSSTAKAKGVALLETYGDSSYAQLAGLSLAKIYINENELDKAAEQLRAVTKHKNSKRLGYYIATVRLAKVLQQQNKFDEALELITHDPDAAYLALYAETRGDLYVAKGQTEDAKRAYKQALNSLPAGVQPDIIQMKLLELGGTDEA